VHWQSWNLAHVAIGPSDVGFVWSAQYGGLKFSGHPINVLQVVSDRPPTYLRATVLDDFRNDKWAIGVPRPADSLEPAAAYRSRNQTRESVTVTALADTHLVGGSIPMRFEAADGAPLVRLEPGFAALNQNLPQGFRYTVWSYAPDPTPAALRRSPPDYPTELDDEGLLTVGENLTALPFGFPNRATVMLGLLTRPDLFGYVPLARLAERLAGDARTPYDAVEKLQQWFLSSGAFHYSNHPPVSSLPLVGFVTKTHVGYCQHFAGAMALMLRYLGIPARVAVGFAGGTYDPAQHLWNISDREAHAWVEVWFKGYGWLPFDPTPAAPGAAPRETQAGLPVDGAPGSTSSRADGATLAAQGASAFEQKLRGNNGFDSSRSRHHGSGSPVPSLGGGSGSGSTDRGRPILLLLAGLAAAVGGIVLAKVGFRLTRGARRDPRGVASACRQELASFLVDQRIEAPRSATLGELGAIFRREFGVDPEAFVTAATAARFGPSEGAAAAALTAKRELRALLEIARRSLTLRERARGLLSLRSLVRPVAVDPTAPAGSPAS
jgi:protein-glutamine gamma-glutamyltransferase